MPLDRLTWFGLGAAILGWVMLIVDTALGPVLFVSGNFAVSAVMRADILSLAETMIFSGFALAILGALRAGFGALHNFFDAVLQRANTPRPAPMPRPDTAPEPLTEPAAIKTPAAPRTRSGKNYTILSNGAVEVETMLGTRVFASLDEARDYIR